MSQKSFFDELEADGLVALDEMRRALGQLRSRVEQKSRRQIVQVAKLNALGNIIFQEALEELKQRLGR